MFDSYPSTPQALAGVLTCLSIDHDDSFVAGLRSMAMDVDVDTRTFAARTMTEFGIDGWDAGIACRLPWA